MVDNTLWTETPAERQQRLADEVMGKKRRVENADPDLEGDDDDAQPEDAHKRRKREAELQRQVEEYTVRPDRLRSFVRGLSFGVIIVDCYLLPADEGNALAIAPGVVVARYTRSGRVEAQERYE